jgi:hypothetical protein
VLDISDANDIDMAGMIQDAQEEAAADLIEANGRFLGRTQPVFMPVEYGVMSLYSESANRPRINLSQVVADNPDYPGVWSELRRWLVFKTLTVFYRNASRRADVDRYRTKRDEYADEVRRMYWPRLVRSGIPIVGTPIPRPAAMFEVGSGTWGSANVTVTGATGTTANYDIAITYYCSQNSSAKESALSDSVTVQAASGQSINIDISTLNPPNGQYRPSATSRIAINPGNATSWRIYAGTSGGTLYQQADIPIATKTYSLTVPFSGTVAASNGQWADLYFTLQNVLFRG